MHNPQLEPKPHSFRILFGQRPLTRFKDYRKAIKVDLIKWDDPEKMLKGTYDFVKATWSEDGKESERATKEEMQEALKAMLSGKALGLGLETVNFVFRIAGITRIDTHQIVRQRIGVTFSQQCTGDRFLTHNDALIEECIAKDDKLLNSVIQTSLNAKETYTLLNDSGQISIQAARGILPHNLETFIFMSVNLATLLFFHQKRIDDGSQTWQINEISQQMANEVGKIYPELTEVFEKNKTRFKFQTEASKDRKNTFSTSLYLPRDNSFDYHTRDFLYNKTKNEMHLTDAPMDEQFYWGKEKVNSEKYDRIKERYSKLDKLVNKNHFSNEEIKTLAEQVNLEIEQ